jgi:glycosyltransferase involved in cell wall biosynthesis
VTIEETRSSDLVADLRAKLAVIKDERGRPTIQWRNRGDSAVTRPWREMRAVDYFRAVRGSSRIVKATIPVPIKRFLKRHVVPPLRYLQYHFRSGEPSKRVEADWEFFTKISNTAQALSLDNPRIAETGRFSVGLDCEAQRNKAQIDEPSERGAVTPLNIVVVSYYTYNNNSALHITGFANALTALGHRVVVSAEGPVGDAGDFGVPRFRCIPHQLIRRDPEALERYFAGNGSGVPDVVHCWTPRGIVRHVASAVVSRYGCPYIVHFEDNEAAVASMGVGSEVPEAMLEFIAGSAGATIIVDALADVLPEGLPIHLLEPGVDGNVFAPNLVDFDRRRLCEALDVPSDAWITVYAGTNNAATVDDIFSLYTAVHALNTLGHKVHLIRTGIYPAPETDARFARFPREHVTNLGFVQRNWLVEILKLADFFVQPGGPNAFNNYRLPSKIPEFLAMGRPVVLARTNVGLRLQDRVNALLMERGDAAEITACVKELLVHPALADRVGRAGRRFAIEHFDWQRSTKQLEGFYRQLLA